MEGVMAEVGNVVCIAHTWVHVVIGYKGLVLQDVIYTLVAG